MPKDFNKAMIEINGIADKFNAKGKTFSEFGDKFASQMKVMETSANKAWRSFSESFRLGKIEESAGNLERINLAIKNLKGAKISNASPAQQSAYNTQMSKLKTDLSKFTGEFKQAIKEYNRSQVNKSKYFSSNYQTFSQKKSLDEVTARKAVESARVRENLKAYESSQLKISLIKKEANERFKIESQNESRLNSLRRQYAKENEKIRAINFRDARVAEIKTTACSGLHNS